MSELNVTSISSTSSKKRGLSFLKWYDNLPRQSRQITRLYTCQIISIVGLVGLSSIFMGTTGRTQLLDKAKAELAVAEINYNIKINQMVYDGFRSPSDQTAIINIVTAQAAKKPLKPQLKQQVKKILQNELKVRNLEYATLVGKDRRIIVNANANRTGEIFDPNKLVSEVFKKSKQIKSNSLVSWNELQKESISLKKTQDALIRYIVTPVKSPNNGSVIGALISGDIVNNSPIVEENIKTLGSGYSGIYLWKPNQEFILATSIYQEQQPSKTAYANIPIADTTLLKNAVANPNQVVTKRSSLLGKNSTYTLAAKALLNWQGKPVGVLVRGTTEFSLNELIINNLLIQLCIAFLVLGTEVLLVKLLRKKIRQMRKSHQTTKQIASDNRPIRADTLPKEELAQISQKADSIISEDISKQYHQHSSSKSLIVLSFSNQLYQSLNIKEILSPSLTEIRYLLQVDRLEIYYFTENHQNGLISAESVKPGLSKILGQTNSLLFKPAEIEQYKQGVTLVINNIEHADFTKERQKIIQDLKIKDSLTAPILQNGELVALLSAHQCEKNRIWQQEEINLVEQLAAQIGFALNQASLVKQLKKAHQDVELARNKAEANSEKVKQISLVAESNALQQRQQKESQHCQMLELLNYVETTATGDLTVRAPVNETELGTVTDFFNLLVEHLQQLVMQVKNPSIQIKTALLNNEWTAGQLSEQARRQALKINHTLYSVEQMTHSMQTIAKNASQTATVVRTAAIAASSGREAIDSTVETMVNLQTTVVKTTDQVKVLNKSAKQITKILSLVQQIGLQAHLLAINASIEVNRGQGSEGFRAIAEQVGLLASQSSIAIQEIEQVVAKIQGGTKEVVTAMEEGTRQVICSTRCVVEAQENLAQIFEVSCQIDQLVAAIASATMSQAHNSGAVTDLLTQIAKTGQQTNEASGKVSHSIRDTLLIAEQLQQSVAQFKLGSETGN